MSLETKAKVYNFIVFALLYLIVRYVAGSFLDFNRYVLMFGAAITAHFLAPKFSAINTKNGEKIMMKWIFIKEIKEL